MALILIAVFMIPMGLILVIWKPADLVAGYNTLPPEKKKRLTRRRCV